MDKRVNNGGHSTKSTGIDRRKNEYKNALSKAITEEDVINVIHALKGKALQGDVKACRLFLEYSLGKPAQVLEVGYSSPEWLDSLLNIDNNLLESKYGIE